MLQGLNQEGNYHPQMEFPFSLKEPFIVFQKLAIRRTGDWQNCAIRTITKELSIPEEISSIDGLSMPVNRKLIIPQTYDVVYSTKESMDARGYCVITPDPMEKPMLTPAFIPMKVREERTAKTEWVDVDV